MFRTDKSFFMLCIAYIPVIKSTVETSYYLI